MGLHKVDVIVRVRAEAERPDALLVQTSADTRSECFAGLLRDEKVSV